MRQQQRYIFDALLAAVRDGSLSLQAEFLTFQDLLACARHAADMLGAVNADFNKNTIQTWLRSGALGDSDKKDRRIRNRLYSAADLIRLVAVWVLSHLGVRLKGAAVTAQEIIKAMETDWFYRSQGIDTGAELDARDLIWVVPGGAEHEGMCTVWAINPDRTQAEVNKLFVLNLMLHGASIVVNAQAIAGTAVSVAGDKHQQKLLLWKDKIKAELAKAKAREQKGR